MINQVDATNDQGLSQTDTICGFCHEFSRINLRVTCVYQVMAGHKLF